MQFINVIYTKSTNILFDNFLVDEYHWITWVSKPLTISNQRRLLESCQAKTTFLSGTQHLIFLLFEDKGRLHAHHNRIKI